MSAQQANKLPVCQPASCFAQDFILPALLYLTAKRPRAWVWVLNITITVVYTLVGVVGAVGSFKLIIEVGH